MMSLRTLERLDIIPMLKMTCNLIILLGFALKILGLSFKISLLNRNSLKSGFYYIKFLVAPFSSLKSGFNCSCKLQGDLSITKVRTAFMSVTI